MGKGYGVHFHTRILPNVVGIEIEMEVEGGPGDALLFAVTSYQIKRGDLLFFFLPCLSFCSCRTYKLHASSSLANSVDLFSRANGDWKHEVGPRVFSGLIESSKIAKNSTAAAHEADRSDFRCNYQCRSLWLSPGPCLLTMAVFAAETARAVASSPAATATADEESGYIPMLGTF